MKRLMMTTAVALLPIVASAQSVNVGSFVTEFDAMNVRASDFIGMRVYTTETDSELVEFDGVQNDWNDIGEINDVVLTRDGEVEAVLVDIGGFLGIGEHHVAVNMDAIRFASDSSTEDEDDDFFLVMSSSQAALENAPEYTWADEVDAMTDAPEIASDETVTGFDIKRDGFRPVERVDLTTEMLTGTPVYDVKDEWIGEVDALLLSDDGNIKQAVVDVGGFLGLGEKPVALEMEKLKILRGDDGGDLRVYVSMTEEELENMPSYDN
jgi:uncharacterized protein YrrD